MTTKSENGNYKKFLMYLSAVFVLILGITLTLVWWDDVVSLFKGFLGIAFALVGLVMLYVFNTKDK